MAARIDPYSLRLFAAVAREGSLARAAASENIAVSALSRRVADLEHVFGTALIIRSARGIELTGAGRLAAARGAKLDIDLQALVREIQAGADKVAGPLRIAANTSAIIGFLPERLKALVTEHPLIRIALIERTSSEVARACLDDLADIGVAVAIEVPGTLETWRFAQDPLIVVLPSGHRLSQQHGVSFADVAPEPIVTVQTGGALDRLLQRQAAMAGVELRISVAVTSFDAVCRMVEAGLGIAIVPRSAATAYAGPGNFVRRPLAEPWAERELVLCAVRKAPRPPIVEAAITALRG